MRIWILLLALVIYPSGAGAQNDEYNQFNEQRDGGKFPLSFEDYKKYYDKPTLQAYKNYLDKVYDLDEEEPLPEKKVSVVMEAPAEQVDQKVEEKESESSETQADESLLEKEEKKGYFERRKKSETPVNPFLNKKKGTLDKKNKLQNRTYDTKRMKRKYKSVSDKKRMNRKEHYSPKSAMDFGQSSEISPSKKKKTRILGK